MNRLELTGMRFGSLTVVKFSHIGLYNNHKHTMWECVCDCGKTVIFRGNEIKRGKRTSCGCGRIVPKKVQEVKIGQTVQFDPFLTITGFASEDNKGSFVPGKVVYINKPHKWFSVEYGSPLMRTSFKFSEIGKEVQICG